MTAAGAAVPEAEVGGVGVVLQEVLQEDESLWSLLTVLDVGVVVVVVVVVVAGGARSSGGGVAGVGGGDDDDDDLVGGGGGVEEGEAVLLLLLVVALVGGVLGVGSEQLAIRSAWSDMVLSFI